MDNFKKKLVFLLTFVMFLIAVGVIEYFLLIFMTNVLTSYSVPSSFGVIGALVCIAFGAILLLFRGKVILELIRDYDTWEKITLALIPRIYLEIFIKAIGFVFFINGIIILLNQ